MKITTILLIWVCLCFVTIKIDAQTYQINAEYDASADTVKQFGKGDILVINYDSVYLLNQMQFRHYQLLMELKVAVTKDNTNMQTLFQDMIKAINKDLAKLNTLNKEMKKNADATSAVGKKLADVTLKNVEHADSLLVAVNQRLKIAENRVDTADAHLEKANKLIEQERKQRFWRNLKWGAIGLGIGILVKSLF